MTTTSTVGSTGASTDSSATSAASAAIYARVQKVMSSQNAAAAKLNTALTADQTKLSGLGQLQSALATYEAVAQSLVGGGLNAITFPPGTATASTDSTAQAASYALNVQQLAQGQLLTSGSVPSETAPIGSGGATTITVDYGTADGGTFAANPNAKPVKITIDSSNNTPDGIAAALQQAGVNAKVVSNPDGTFALAISGPSGAANSMRIGVSGDAAIGKLLGYDPAGTQNMSQTTAAQDAKLTVAGVAVTSATNTIAGSIPGVTLNLTAVGKTSLTIAPSATQVAANVNAFVSAYNVLNGKLQALQTAGLGNDPAVKQVTNQIAQLLKTGGSGGALAALKAAGVTQDDSGNLQVDAGKLTAAANANPGALSQLISNSKGGGLADQLGTLATGFSSANGAITRETNTTNIDLTNVTNKRSVLSTALTAQANALVALYTAQAQDSSGSSSGGASSLWDML